MSVLAVLTTGDACEWPRVTQMKVPADLQPRRSSGHHTTLAIQVAVHTRSTSLRDVAPYLPRPTRQTCLRGSLADPVRPIGLLIRGGVHDSGSRSRSHDASPRGWNSILERSKNLSERKAPRVGRSRQDRSRASGRCGVRYRRCADRPG